MRILILLLLSALPICGMSELPRMVIEACFSAKMIDHTSAQSWAITSANEWAKRPMQVQEIDGKTRISQKGASSSTGWISTEIMLETPASSERNPQPRQTLTYTATVDNTLPKIDLSMMLIADKPLPPCSVEAIGNATAIIAKDATWYILFANEQVKVHHIKKNGETRYSVETTAKSISKNTSLVEIMYVGEGSLPTTL